ncbi:ATPase domain-containing protein [Thermococcus sp. GR6]|uniref:RAD55 family ATPase n=1 Tax=Thermococcus sp. GR6 TaxID=1638256 RepID=UPI00143178C4|nr:ATPase domain-containing protein [Thermococcus sp. GR6]NJE41898.1 ATPase [Thermococcus sp. GR6]
MERISTGIKGLDKMLEGGLIPGRTYLVKGGPGTGKTTLTIQFLTEGVKNGEDVLYVTLEESLKTLKEDMSKMGFNLDDPKFDAIDATPVTDMTHNIFAGTFYETFGKSFEKLMSSIQDKVKSKHYSRVAIDPLTMLKLTVKDELDYRTTFIGFLKSLSELGATVILTSDLKTSDVEEYLVSGVIELKTLEVSGRILRGIIIRKFRGSSFDEQIRPYKITTGGIRVYNNENIFVE